jgi:hypothetical protein
MQSHLQSKSAEFSRAAELLHNNTLYSAVAHSAYYSCFQLLKHIWLFSMKKDEQQLNQELKLRNRHARHSGAREVGSHEFLIIEVGSYIKKSAMGDFRLFTQNINQLKRLRRKADYENDLFGFSESSKSLSLSRAVMPVLKKY